MKQYFDIHTHNPLPDHDAIISVSPTDFVLQLQQNYSIGIHPWNTIETTPKIEELLHQTLQHHNVVAIGECGIDRLRGASIPLQQEIFEKHIILSETLHKPLIIHTVRSTDIILAMHRKHHPKQQWIVHGFRNNAATALQLLNAGIELSFGEKFNPQALQITPIEKLWIESDESKLNITDIYKQIALAKNCDIAILQQSIYNRSRYLFFATQ